MNTEIIVAINNMQLLQFYYDGGYRIVEPHCYGITTANNEGLRAYQTVGHSESGKYGWKMFDLSKASDIDVLNENYTSPREGYKRGDKGMKTIYKEL